MRYVYYSDYESGRKFITDSELKLTHIVFGQRDEKPEKEKLAPKEKVNLSPEERVAVARFVSDLTLGWYAMKPMAWCGSEEEANTTTEKFKANGWINVEVKKINQQYTLPHA